MKLSENTNSIAKSQEDVKLSVAKTQSAEIGARKELDRKTLKNEADKKLKVLKMELEKANMDEHIVMECVNLTTYKMFAVASATKT